MVINKFVDSDTIQVILTRNVCFSSEIFFSEFVVIQY